MKRNYRFDELVKMIKKNHVDSLSNDVLDMQREIERLRAEVMDLKARNESLKKTIENDPSYILGKAVAKYVKDAIKTDVMNNLNVEVDSEWDPYSGEREHHHITNIYWNEDE